MKGKKEKEKKRKRLKRRHGQGSNLKPSKRGGGILNAQADKVHRACEVEKFCFLKMTLDAHLIHVPFLLISALSLAVS